MRVDEEGKIWFEKGDHVRPRMVKRMNRDTRQEELVPHEKPMGGLRFEDGQIVERKLPDVVILVDEASGQFQLKSWFDGAKETGNQSLRTRWEPSDWYEVMPEPAKRPGRSPKATESEVA